LRLPDAAIALWSDAHASPSRRHNVYGNVSRADLGLKPLIVKYTCTADSERDLLAPSDTLPLSPQAAQKYKLARAQLGGFAGEARHVGEGERRLKLRDGVATGPGDTAATKNGTPIDASSACMAATFMRSPLRPAASVLRWSMPRACPARSSLASHHHFSWRSPAALAWVLPSPSAFRQRSRSLSTHRL
jgi:hypothetical protein